MRKNCNVVILSQTQLRWSMDAAYTAKRFHLKRRTSRDSHSKRHFWVCCCWKWHAATGNILRSGANTSGANTTQNLLLPAVSVGAQKRLAHFVLNCPRFQVLRSVLFGQVSTIIPIFNNCNSVSKLNLLLYGRGLNKNDQIKVANLFQNYIIKTKRFQNQ